MTQFHICTLYTWLSAKKLAYKINEEILPHVPKEVLNFAIGPIKSFPLSRDRSRESKRHLVVLAEAASSKMIEKGWVGKFEKDSTPESEGDNVRLWKYYLTPKDFPPGLRRELVGPDEVAFPQTIRIAIVLPRNYYSQQARATEIIQSKINDTVAWGILQLHSPIFLKIDFQRKLCIITYDCQDFGDLCRLVTFKQFMEGSSWDSRGLHYDDKLKLKTQWLTD